MLRGYGLILALTSLTVALAACGAGTETPTTSTGGAGTARPTDTAAATASITHTTVATPGTMGATPAASATDAAFLSNMIVHHEGAIRMAQIAQQRAEHEEIRQLADDIIAAQQQEIDMMQTWRRDWFAGTPGPGGTYGMGTPGMGMPGMGHVTATPGMGIPGMGMDPEALQQAEPFDQAFIDMMIEHHQGAISMAEQIRQTTQRPELRSLADDIITAQTREIEQMRAWRAQWYGE